MIEEEERVLWRAHVALGDWPSYERWALAAARRGQPAGLEFVRASRRYVRTVGRAQFRSAARYGAKRAVQHRERALAAVFALQVRGRIALRELRRTDRLPRTPGSGGALLADLTDQQGRRIRQRSTTARDPLGMPPQTPDAHQVLADLRERVGAVTDDAGWSAGRRIVAVADTRVGRVRFSVSNDGTGFRLYGNLLDVRQEGLLRYHGSFALGTLLPGHQRFDAACWQIVEQIADSLERAGEEPRNFLRVPPTLTEAVLRLHYALARPDNVVHGLAWTLLDLIGLPRNFSAPASDLEGPRGPVGPFSRRVMNALCGDDGRCAHGEDDWTCGRTQAQGRILGARADESRGVPLRVVDH